MNRVISQERVAFGSDAVGGARRVALAAIVGFGMVAALMLVGRAALATPSHPPLFGTREARSTNLAPFPKWTGMLERYFGDPALGDGACGDTPYKVCHLAGWKTLIDSLRGADPETQLDRINRYMNRAPYIVDPRNYNVPDYWATPRQFFERDGDCEDYAIAKYLSLRALGWPVDSMRIVVLQDLNLKIPHAVLVVYREGQALVLDNQIARVVNAARIRHYRPFYSINEDGWWIHRP